MIDPRIPEEKAARVFERAAQLHAARNKGYSRGELTGAGEEVDLPAACIDQALAQLDAEEAQARLRRERRRSRHRAIRRTALVGGAVLLAATEMGAQQQQALLNALAAAQRDLRSSSSPAQAIAAEQTVQEVFAQVRRQVLGDSASRSHSLFTGLQDEVAGTENRMAVERMRYNQAPVPLNPAGGTHPREVFKTDSSFPRQRFCAARVSFLI